MTTAVRLPETGGNRSEQLEQLRRKMALLSGSRPEPVTRTPVVAAAAPPENELSGIARSLPEPDLAVVGAGTDASLQTVLGAVHRGAVTVVSGARSLSLQVVAAVTAAGGHAAIVGQPDAGLLAAVEMGADLSRLAVVPDPGHDPVEVAAVLLDGVDLVVLDLRGRRSVPPGRARAVTARARQKNAILLVTGADWPGAAARLHARVGGYQVSGPGTGAPVPGCGRISRVQVVHGASGRALRRSCPAAGE